MDVRIWGHYAVIDGNDVKYYRHPIRKFDFTELDGKEKWTAYTFVRNIYDLWLPKHFERICDIINMLPTDLDSNIFEQDQEQLSSGSGLSQQLGNYDLGDEQGVLESRPSVQPSTPDTTIGSGSTKSRKKKEKPCDRPA